MVREEKQTQERSKISLRIGEVQIELEGTNDDIRQLMNKNLVDFAKGLEGTTKQLPPSTGTIPKIIPIAPEPPKTSEIAPKEKIVPPPPSKSAITSETFPKKSRSFTYEKKTEETGKKKIGWRKLAIALVLACIVLLASVIGVIAFYLPTVNSLESQIVEKDINIATLNSTVSALHSQITSLQTSLNQNNNTLTNLQETVEYLNSVVEHYLNIVTMNASSYIFSSLTFNQNQSEFTTIFQDTLQYAGYVRVSVESTSDTTYVQTRYYYASGLLNYDQNITVAESGSAYFPVLPGVVEIRVGNNDTYTGDSITMTASAIYYY